MTMGSNVICITFSDVILSVCLSDGGIVKFCRDHVKDNTLADSKKSALEIIKVLLNKNSFKASQYVDGITVSCDLS